MTAEGDPRDSLVAQRVHVPMFGMEHAWAISTDPDGSPPHELI